MLAIIIPLHAYTVIGVLSVIAVGLLAYIVYLFLAPKKNAPKEVDGYGKIAPPAHINDNLPGEEKSDSTDTDKQAG